MDAGTILGPYRFDRELGAGGMGTVFEATLLRDSAGLPTGATVAVKIVHQHLLEIEGSFKRFLREARIGQTVDHPNVVRTLDCDAVGGVHFLVMEHVRGQTLHELQQELGRVPEELCRHVAREVCRGLAAIHAAGVVHRDLKPENVLITPDHVVKIMDLGVARSMDDALHLSQTGAFVGSVHYAAPEQFEHGSGDLDGRADLHALGLLLYELASGVCPFVADDVRAAMYKVLHERPRRLGELNPQVSAFFEETVHRLLAKHRDARFGSAEELLGVLEQGERSAWWRGHAAQIRESTRRPLRRPRIPRETSVYGRDHELSVLRGLFDRAKAGEGHVALVEGEAGIGKSRLVDELLARLLADGEDVSFVYGGYPPGGAATAESAWTTAYREHLGEAGSGRVLRGTPALARSFDAFLRGEPLPDDAPPFTKDALQTCFVQATRALGEERPTIVLIDDLHFAPAEGRALFAALATAVPTASVLLVGTARRGLPQAWVAGLERASTMRRITLGRLGPQDLTRLLIDAFHSERLAEELAFRIAQKSDGNPYFVFEIIQGLRDRGAIRRLPSGTWVQTAAIRDLEIPSSVRDLIRARLGAISHEDRDLLDVASCCGYGFDPSVVAEAIGENLVPTLRRLARIERSHRLVHSSGRRFTFDHHQVQEALYEGTPALLRREYHAALGSALEQRVLAATAGSRAVDGPAAVELCHHLLAGERFDRARRHVEPALGHLATAYLHEPLLDLATRALDATGMLVGAPRMDVLFRKAAALALVGRRDEERAALREALALAEEDGDRRAEARARAAIGWSLFHVARFDEARRALVEAIDVARAAGDREREAVACGNLGMALYSQGAYDEARGLFERQMEIALAEGIPRAEGTAAGSLALLARAVGRLDEARAMNERYLAISRRCHDRRGEVIALTNLGGVLRRLGDHEGARGLCEEQLRIAREIGYRRAEAAAAANLALYFRASGRMTEALEHCEVALGIEREIGDRLGQTVTLTDRGEALRELGRLGRARADGTASLALARALRARREESYALTLLAHVEERSGNAGEAATLHREALALRREIGYPLGIAASLLALGGLEASAGRAGEAAAHLTEAVRIADEVGAAGVGVLGRCRLAELPGGDVTSAREAFDVHREELALTERMEARYRLWAVGQDPSDLAAARRLLDRLRLHAPEEWRDAVTESVPLHRAIAAASGDRPEGPGA